jgi:signal transduction histidine kinase
VEPQQWVAAAAATGQLGLAIAAAVRGARSPLALPLALVCFDLFAFNAAELAYTLSGDERWSLLDHATSPLAWPLILHFVLLFTGTRRRFASILLCAYAAFGILASSALVATLWTPALEFNRSDAWDYVHLCALAPVALFIVGLLVAHLRLSIDGEARQRTRLLLVALAIGVPLGVTDLFRSPVPPLAAEGVLLAAVLVAVVALRLHLFGQDMSTSRATYAWALAALVAIVYATLFGLLRTNAALLVLGSASLGLLLALILGVAKRGTAVRQARAKELLSLGGFAKQLAHDLKNPLAALKGAVDLLQEERRRGASLDAHASFLDLIAEQIGRIERSLAEYQRLGRVEPARTPLHLDELVRDVMALEPLAAPPGVLVTLELASVPEMVADRELLVRAVENLVANAFEAMPEGGTLTVRTGRDARAALVAVIDTGRGMDPATAERACDDFFTTKPQGSGLGLPFARRVALAHGGDLRVVSRPGAGTKVEIRLPLE